MKRDYPVKRPARMRPAHPGAVLRDDVLPALGATVAAAARDLGISRETLHAILAERAPVTPEMALRLGRWCGNGPHLWLICGLRCSVITISGRPSSAWARRSPRCPGGPPDMILPGAARFGRRTPRLRHSAAAPPFTSERRSEARHGRLPGRSARRRDGGGADT
jgi:addiction module HigA family antidote